LVRTTANRAVKNLWELKPWTKLTKQIQLTLTNNSTPLPADLGRVVEMYGAFDSTGVPSYWYYEQDDESGYRIDWNWSKSAGAAPVMTFYYEQPTAIYMRYQHVLEDFTDVIEQENGDGAQYSFFPANLVILEAERINCLEKHRIREWQMIEKAHADAVRNYSNANQWVNYGAMAQINDRMGNKVLTQNFTLAGSRGRRLTTLPNSHIL
jgi:hypothetical protein